MRSSIPPSFASGTSRYDLLFEVARGGMGEVFVGRQVVADAFERPVAIKRMKGDLAQDEHFVRMFLDEARIAAWISSPNVVQTLDVTRDHEGIPYIVMELVVGLSLADLSRACATANEQIPLPLCVEIIAQAAAGLDDAHRATSPNGDPLGLVHRDISPQNIMIGVDGRVRIADFGVARARLRASETDAGHLKGKLGYFSPEQARGETLDARSDVFSLGIVFWETLAGKRLFPPGNTAMPADAVADPIAALWSMRSEVPAAIVDAVAHTLHRQVNNRMARASELALQLRHVQSQAGQMTSPADVGAFVTHLGGSALANFRHQVQAAFRTRTIASERPRGNSPPDQNETLQARPKSAPSNVKAPVSAPPPSYFSQDDVDARTSWPDLSHALSANGRSAKDRARQALRYLTASPQIGRDAEVARATLLLEEHRWLTITGPAGIGKTRLAAELATLALEAGTETFVLDCHVATAASLTRLLLQCIRGKESRGEEGELELVRVLARLGTVNVILDHPEFVTTPLAALLTTLRKQSDARFIVASRSTLGVAEECVLRLKPLSTEPHGAQEILLRQCAHKLDVVIDEGKDLRSLLRQTGGNPLAAELAAHAIGAVGFTHASDFFQTEGISGEMHPAIAKTFSLLEEAARDALIAASTLPDSFTPEDIAMLTGDPKSVVRSLGALVRASFAHQVSDGRFALFSMVSEVVSKQFPEHRKEFEQKLREIVVAASKRGEGELVDAYFRRLRSIRVRVEQQVEIAIEQDDGVSFETTLTALADVAVESGGVREVQTHIDRWMTRGRTLTPRLWCCVGDLAADVHDTTELARALEGLEKNAPSTAHERASQCRLQSIQAFYHRDPKASLAQAHRGLELVEGIDSSILRSFVTARLTATITPAAYFAGNTQDYVRFGQLGLAAARNAGSTSEEVGALWSTLIGPMGAGDFDGAIAIAERSAHLARVAEGSTTLVQAIRFVLLAQSLSSMPPDELLWEEFARLDAQTALQDARHATAAILVLGRLHRFRELREILVNVSSESMMTTLFHAHDWCIVGLGFSLIGDAEQSSKCMAQARARSDGGASFYARHAPLLIAYTQSLLEHDEPTNSDALGACRDWYWTRLVLAAGEIYQTSHANAVLRIANNGAWAMAADTHVDLSGKPVLRELLLVLAQSHQENPFHGLSYEELSHKLWKQTRITDTLRTRVRASIANLRKMGIHGIENHDGYRLMPSMIVLFE